MEVMSLELHVIIQTMPVITYYSVQSHSGTNKTKVGSDMFFCYDMEQICINST